MDKRFFVAEDHYKRLDVFLSEQMEEFTRSRIKKEIYFLCLQQERGCCTTIFQILPVADGHGTTTA